MAATFCPAPAVVVTPGRRLYHPQDWNTSYLYLFQQKAQFSASRCFGLGNGSGRLKRLLKAKRIQCGRQNIFLSLKAATEARVSGRGENVTSDGDTSNGSEVLINSDLNKKENVNPSASIDNTNTPVVADAAKLVAGTVEEARQNVSPVVETKVAHMNDVPAAVKTVLFWVCAAIAFGIYILLRDGTGKASEFFAGYLVEQSLSVDNLFVFVVVFKYFHVPLQYQTRILTYGILGAVIFRATMIFLGVATIQRFEAANLFFAGILIFASYKLLTEVEEDGDEDLSNNFIVNTCRKFIPVTAYYDEDNFFTRTEGPLKATPLFLTLAIIELSDVAFAIDSIPAVFGVTRDPFIVFSSNIFAILGLRSLYILISSSMSELDYLQPSVAIVLGFIGSKMVGDFLGFHISTEISLGVVVSVLGLGIGLSLLKNRKNGDD